MRWIFIFYTVVFCFLAIAQNITKPLSSESSQKPLSTVEILKLPLAERIHQLQKYSSFYHLARIFRNQNHHDSIRWNALMSIARLHPQKSTPYIRQALHHSSWFFKNAGLIAMEMVNPQRAVVYAVRFLEHPSLVLRTASVEVIRRQKAVQHTSLLWNQLSDKKNFRKGQSLWIRRYIVQALSSFSKPSDTQRFLVLLEDPDPNVRSIALQTIHQLTPVKQPIIAREGSLR